MTPQTEAKPVAWASPYVLSQLACPSEFAISMRTDLYNAEYDGFTVPLYTRPAITEAQAREWFHVWLNEGSGHGELAASLAALRHFGVLPP